MEQKKMADILSELEKIIKSKSVIGESIYIGDTVIVPFIDVSFGAGEGGGNCLEKNKSMGMGSGVGAKMEPSAVLVISNGNTQLVNIKNQDSLNKLLDMVPSLLNKLGLDKWIKKDDETENSKDKKVEIITSDSE